MFLLQMDNPLEVQVDDVSVWLSKFMDTVIEYAPKVVAAILIYIIGRWLISWISKILLGFLRKRSIDPSLQTFFSSFIRIGLLAMLFLAIIGIVGVPIAGFAAILAGLTFGIGSALNGSLGNVAGGIMILVTKPFKIGDLIEAQGNFGLVREIGIVDTTILTSQNKTIHLPNGALSTGVIVNYTDQENFRIDIKVAIKDETDFEWARKVAIEAMKAHPDVIDDPAPNVRITELTGDGPVLVLWPRIKIKPYDKRNPRQIEADYYSVYFGVRERVYKAFVENGIQTPDATLEVEVRQKQ